MNPLSAMRGPTRTACRPVRSGKRADRGTAWHNRHNLPSGSFGEMSGWRTALAIVTACRPVRSGNRPGERGRPLPVFPAPQSVQLTVRFVRGIVRCSWARPPQSSQLTVRFVRGTRSGSFGKRVDSNATASPFSRPRPPALRGEFCVSLCASGLSKSERTRACQCSRIVRVSAKT